jgi:hypothetical protein
MLGSEVAGSTLFPAFHTEREDEMPETLATRNFLSISLGILETSGSHGLSNIATDAAEHVASPQVGGETSRCAPRPVFR